MSYLFAAGFPIFGLLVIVGLLNLVPPADHELKDKLEG